MLGPLTRFLLEVLALGRGEPVYGAASESDPSQSSEASVHRRDRRTNQSLFRLRVIGELVQPCARRKRSGSDFRNPVRTPNNTAIFVRAQSHHQLCLDSRPERAPTGIRGRPRAVRVAVLVSTAFGTEKNQF